MMSYLYHSLIPHSDWLIQQEAGRRFQIGHKTYPGFGPNLGWTFLDLLLLMGVGFRKTKSNLPSKQTVFEIQT